jgi:hypothetical protein
MLFQAYPEWPKGSSAVVCFFGNSSYAITFGTQAILYLSILPILVLQSWSRKETKWTRHVILFAQTLFLRSLQANLFEKIQIRSESFKVRSIVTNSAVFSCISSNQICKSDGISLTSNRVIEMCFCVVFCAISYLVSVYALHL